MSETPEARLKRLRIRGWRRGTKEMDLLLGPYCDALLEGRVETDLDALETFMNENDQDLYQWISGGAETPAALVPMVEEIRRFHRIDG